jgi:hypothetical protein
VRIDGVRLAFVRSGDVGGFRHRRIV